jgi:hypothetical protein
MRRVLFPLSMAVTLFAMVGCGTLASSPEKLVGTWIWPRKLTSKGGETEDEATTTALRKPGNTLVTVYKADRTCVEGVLGKPPSAWGRWWLQGSYLIRGMQSAGSDVSMERVRIVSLDDQMLVVSDGTRTVQYRRSHAESGH